MQSHLERISFDLILLLPLVLYLPGGCIRPFQSQVVPLGGTDLGTATCSSVDEFICFVLDRAKKKVGDLAKVNHLGSRNGI